MDDIGDVLADFGVKRCFLLYGPGGGGKSTLANMIKTCISDKVFDLFGDNFLKHSDEGKGYTNNLTMEQLGKAQLGTALFRTSAVWE
jgi:replication-associated recombination protein RarA